MDGQNKTLFMFFFYEVVNKFKLRKNPEKSSGATPKRNQPKGIPPHFGLPNTHNQGQELKHQWTAAQ